MVSEPTVISYQWRPSAVDSWRFTSQSYGKTTDMVSFNNYPLNTDIDDGNVFLLRKIHDRPVFTHLDYNRYKGPVTIAATPSSYTLPARYAERTDAQMRADGTTGIARSAPVNPAFDMSTAIGELMSDGIPSLVANSLDFRRRGDVARKAGSDYLAVEFGWKPLIQDIRSFAKVVKHSEQILDNYRKGSDTKIRCGYDGARREENVILQNVGFTSSPLDANCSGSGNFRLLRSERNWFRGAFRYHIPVADDTVGKFKQWASMADHLLGVKVTPATLWNIAPWSWAIDWFTNTGDILANVSNLGRDGLVLQYGYQMHETVRLRQVDGFIRPNFTWPKYFASREVEESFKRRIPATPFGFGIDLTSLSARQVAIITALGLSKT